MFFIIIKYDNDTPFLLRNLNFSNLSTIVSANTKNIHLYGLIYLIIDEKKLKNRLNALIQDAQLQCHSLIGCNFLTAANDLFLRRLVFIFYHNSVVASLS